MTSNQPSLKEKVNVESVSGKAETTDDSESSIETNIDNIDRNGLLFDAIENGNVKIIQELLKNGHDPNTRNSMRQPTLFIASLKGNMQIINLLWCPLSRASVMDHKT